MTKLDINKPIRDRERRFLNRNGWLAVIALKKNSSKVWKWIHPKYKRAFNRKEAIKITQQW